MLLNILDQEDLLLFENHSLKTTYKIQDMVHKKVTKLMLLIDLVEKYPTMNNVIEKYIKRMPPHLVLEEINSYTNYNFCALDICIAKMTPSIKTIKILLDNGANINKQDSDGLTSWYIACTFFNRNIIQLTLEYDAINIKTIDGKYQYDNCSNKQCAIINKINSDIALLNSKN